MIQHRSSLVPTAQQLAWQEAGFGLFLHFGVNTFFGREWSDGTLPASGFDPADLDARQWAETAVAAGARYVVLTAKHHDGFCLWPTATTDYSVASSPWREGRGDVVGELAKACREHGLGFGLYLSPWDRNAACYDDPPAYDDFYVRQLTELCTGYGPLIELWFDGAGSEGRAYDWERIMAVVDEHQPDAMVFNLGRPTIRWVGNEDGLASDPCRYVVGSVERSIYATRDDDLGGLSYLPPECDVPLRAHWFWQPDDLETLKSRDHLLALWYRSVGLGAGLLLNVGPDRRGLIDAADRARLLEFGDELRRRFAAPQPAQLADGLDGMVADFGTMTEVDHLELREDLGDGQLVTGFEVRDAQTGGLIASGATVGVRRIVAFEPVAVQRLRIVLQGEGGKLRGVTGFRTGTSKAPDLEEQPAAEPAKFSLSAP